MPKKNSKALAVVPERPAPSVRMMAGRAVIVDAVFHVRGVHPTSPGPWLAEADKIAWTDGTGFGCIIRRSGVDGHLGGYVGVPAGHPLHGWTASAIAGLGVRVHGGVKYSATCMSAVSENVSICHVQRPAERAAAAGRTVSAHREHDDLWWIGFECDEEYDAVPEPHRSYAEVSTYDGTIEPTYKDESFVFEQCTYLAEQLAAIALGRDPLEVEGPTPLPLGMVPSREVRS